ncbi:DUF998 domain-containing protein [Paenibacillus antri]|nr:DUF998 domain-containing protein [Paenibacillus antri]
MNSSNSSNRKFELLRLLPLGAIAGPVLFTLAWVVLGFLSDGYTIYGERIEPYSAVTQPISGLGMGATAPYMNGAFIASGILLFAGLLGVFRRMRDYGKPSIRKACLASFALSPIGLIVCGLYDLEQTLMHSIGFLLSTGTTVVSFVIGGFYFRDIPNWRRFGNAMLAGSPLTLLLVIFFFMSFDPIAAGQGVGIGGIASRVLALEVLGWFALMGWNAWANRLE